MTRMREATLAAACGALLAAGALAGPAAAQRAGSAREMTVRAAAGSLPRTRAERTSYAETSTYADVIAFLDSLRVRAGGAVWLGSMGRTNEGREIPYVIASNRPVATPAEARRLGRPVVYVQGNIHAGEVEGKEALLALLRDLVFEGRPNALDSLVLIAVPIYNADGNEKFAAQARNRGAQNGPEMVGQRPNAQGLDLNRDYIKAEAPETRAALALLNAWDPDVFVDLHTTDGSYHGYALTYSPSLNPAAPLGAWARDTLLPELRRRVRRRGFETYDYGNFSDEDGRASPTDTLKDRWATYDHRPRFGTNYYGLRNRVSVLSEAYSHDPFERRVLATYAYVDELLSLVASRRDRVRAMTVAADWVPPAAPASARETPIRSELTTTPKTDLVISEDLVRVADSSAVTQPGVQRGLRRTGHFRTQRMPVYDRFTPTLRRARPAAYALDSTQADALRLLRLHGVLVERLAAPEQRTVERFVVDSVVKAQRPFQGHNEVRLAGRWERVERTLAAGTYIVPSLGQPLGILATYLLEPESDDGLVTWNVFDPQLRAGGEFPVLRLVEPVIAPRRLVP
ncbi:MAG: M14 family metallopeptidase [Gemmatimonadaceae bacterium]